MKVNNSFVAFHVTLALFRFLFLVLSSNESHFISLIISGIENILFTTRIKYVLY